MKKFLFALMGFICAISVNCAAGAVGASALGVQPVYGVLAVNGVSFLSGLCGASPEIPLFHTIFRLRPFVLYTNPQEETKFGISNS